MAAVTVSQRISELTGGNRRMKLFKITVASSGDTLDTRLRKIQQVLITNPQDVFTVTGTLVGGTIAIVDARIAAGDRAIVSRVSNAGTDGHLEVVITEDTATVTSSSGADTSVVEVSIFPPRITGHAASGGTITFGIESTNGDVVGAWVTAIGI